jgi:hypothetical protein
MIAGTGNFVCNQIGKLIPETPRMKKKEVCVVAPETTEPGGCKGRGGHDAAVQGETTV